MPPQPPKVTSLFPTFGLNGGGNTVTVYGVNFTGVTGVMFGAVPMPTPYTSVSDTSISGFAPNGPMFGGIVTVSVHTPAGVSSPNPPGDQYTYA